MVKLSRSKLELFTECPRCFWLDMRHKIKRPPPPPYTINNAVDYLLKQEFDVHRGKGTPHPIMVEYGVQAVPFSHEKIGEWRHNFTGVQHHHKPTDFLVYGAVDDIWMSPHTKRGSVTSLRGSNYSRSGVGVNPEGELHVVDYKATGANQHQIYDSYKRQMEIYQWLLRKNGFQVSDVGYFVFARVNKGEGFGVSSDSPSEALAKEGVLTEEGAQSGGRSQASLPFDLFVESHEGDDSWVEGALSSAREIYDIENPPPASDECAYCSYRRGAQEVLP